LELYEWQREKIQARLDRANSGKAAFYNGEEVDAVIETFAP
jgi:hypothetical protein